jgi:hypothetical protein
MWTTIGIYFSVLMSYIRHALFHRDLILVGSECRVRWSWERTPSVRVISFAPEPMEPCDFDMYGWSLDSVFMHVPSMWQMLSFVRRRSNEGHSFVSVSLIYASLSE